MKKILPLIFVLLVAACSDSDEPVITSQMDSLVETALSPVAQKARDMAVQQANDILAHGRASVIEASDVSLANTRLCGSRATSDTCTYIVEFSDNNGFAIVNPYLKNDAVLAIITDGTFEETVNAENPVFNQCLENALSFNPPTPNDSAIVRPPHKHKTEHKVERITRKLCDYPPKTDHLKWKQGHDWATGFFCPNGVAGCGPLAIAIASAYFKDPITITYTFSARDISSETINWDEVNKVTYTRASFAPLNESELTIARICAQIGIWSDADYSDSTQTSTISYNCIDAMHSIMPSRRLGQWTKLNTLSQLEDGIRDGMAFVRGDQYLKNTAGQWKRGDGHMWVADGYYYKKVSIFYYEADGDIMVMGPDGKFDYEWYLTGTDTEVTEMIYYNLGWGNGSGYYTSTIFTPQGHKDEEYRELYFLTIK